MNRSLCVLMVVSVFLFASCDGDNGDNRTTPSASTSDPGSEIVRGIVYRTVEDTELTLDVYGSDAKTARPAILIVYGGGWQTGSNAGLTASASALVSQGFVVIAPNYREAPPGGVWHAPAPLQDLQAVVEWSHANADRYGIDSGSIGAVGWSSGANLALLLGMAGDAGENKIDAVVALSPPTDLIALFEGAGEYDKELLLNYLGCPVSECRSLWEDMSPLLQVDDSSAPALLINGSDELIPTSQSEDLAAAYEESGVEVRLKIVPGTKHGRHLVPSAGQDIVAFLRAQLID